LLYAKAIPGITGLWQVSGRNRTTYAERIAYDSYYVRNWSVWMDVYLLAKTITVVLTGYGAY
jgi:lipopolysaccharide/colanic/teichoic acid biosynthesis glycosyltransferase